MDSKWKINKYEIQGIAIIKVNSLKQEKCSLTKKAIYYSNLICKSFLCFPKIFENTYY